jgi:hypothetical protein
MITVGDVVELLPTNNRNRQLRSQEGKHIWKVLKIEAAMCTRPDLGFLIQSVKDSSHERWVLVEDITIHEYKENELR